jgi:hypothetical protein
MSLVFLNRVLGIFREGWHFLISFRLSFPPQEISRCVPVSNKIVCVDSPCEIQPFSLS